MLILERAFTKKSLKFLKPFKYHILCRSLFGWCWYLSNFALQCTAVIDPLTLDHMDVSSKQEKIKMDALCELTAKIQQNPHPGKVFLLVQNKHSVHVSVGFARTASLNSNLKKTPITIETLLKEAGYSFSRLWPVIFIVRKNQLSLCVVKRFTGMCWPKVGCLIQWIWHGNCY